MNTPQKISQNSSQNSSKTPLSPADLQTAAQTLIQRTGQVVLGKESVIRQALCCILADGHLLLEDLPGLGKTTLAHALARGLGIRFRRLQFTADMLPADILGVSIFEPHSREFRFQPGPIFTEILLADEINRAPPKVQSALLEAMEERQVTIEGKRYPLPEAFFVIATQNPLHQQGTYPLPESQLDRFALILGMGYPPAAVERALLKGQGGRVHINDIEPVLDARHLAQMRRAVRGIFVADPVIDYVQRLLQASRELPDFAMGLSPRAGLMLLNLARAWAYIDQRDHVLPDDIQAVLPGLVAHRLPISGTRQNQTSAEQLLAAVKVE